MNKYLIASTLLLLTSPVFAGDQTPSVDRREQRQEARIEQGEASGELTQREANRLEAQQERNELAEARAKADGTVTPAERARLQQRENRSSRAIRRQKHDRQEHH